MRVQACVPSVALPEKETQPKQAPRAISRIDWFVRNVKILGTLGLPTLYRVAVGGRWPLVAAAWFSYGRRPYAPSQTYHITNERRGYLLVPDACSKLLPNNNNLKKKTTA